MSGRAVEAAGDVDTLLLDKTGTITLGNRQATEFKPVRGVTEQELADASQLASLADETPEGRSIVVLAKEKYGIRGRDVAEIGAKFIPFTAQSRMSGVELGSSWVRKGAVDAILNYLNAPTTAVEGSGAVRVPTPAVSAEATREVQAIAETIAKSGATPLAVARDGRLLGVIELKDIVKGGIRERFAELRRMGIRTIMITGDNPMTATAIAAEAGVDDFLAQATPEDKLRLIQTEQSKGKLVAMCGDGTNDAPALAQADVGVAMNTGTQAAREAGNMVDLDSNPTKLIEIVEIGKQLLMTRGALTTFSIANDVAKYFAIIPAMFATLYIPKARPRPARRAQHHASAQRAERDPVGDHLQRADHRRAHPAGAEGRRLSPDRRGLAVAPQLADLRRRRRDHPVHRHQGDRPARHRLASGLRRKSMLREIRPAVILVVALSAITGLAYPLAMTGIAEVIFPQQAQGSLIERDGKVVGSALIGQLFTSDKYFHGRPSATNTPDPKDSSKNIDAPYNAANSGGSNLGPTNKALIDRITADMAKLKAENPTMPVPIDLVTTSASGLDPDISPDAALFQVPRVAKARNMPQERVRALVAERIEGRTFGLLGEPRVNVLQLNLALDAATK